MSLSKNIVMLSAVAKQLGPLCNELVFVGGSTLGLYITDEFIPDVRATLDVDTITDVISIADYYRLTKKLEKQGFSQKIDDEVICRWRYQDLILDVMPSDPIILGFSNEWYQEAIENKVTANLDGGVDIDIVSPPYFLATKLCAFHQRGQDDYLGSHDLEDIISLIDGRHEIVSEVLEAPTTVRQFLASEFEQLLGNNRFTTALPGHLNYTILRSEREKMILEKMQLISQAGSMV